jgi:hypothetical protein
MNYIQPVPSHRDVAVDLAAVIFRIYRGAGMDRLKGMRLLAPVLILTLVSSVTVAQDAGATSVASVAWLAGCWSAEQGEAGSGEQWLPPAGGTMLGVSRTVKKGKTVEFEFMQLRLDEQGKLVLIALPSGQKETTFVASASSKDSVTFENPQHDFPQRVSYRLHPGGRLIARIEGMRKGTLQRVEFPFKRVSCEALAGG